MNHCYRLHHKQAASKYIVQHKRGRSSHRREHLHALAEVADEGHDGHLLHEPLDFTELHHEAVLICQALQGLALLLKLTQDLDLVFCGLETHQTLHIVHRQGAEVEAERKE